MNKQPTLSGLSRAGALPQRACSASDDEVTRHYTWRVRKENKDGSFSVVIYTMRFPVTAKQVADSPSVREWLRGGKLSAVLPYSLLDPETEPNAKLRDAASAQPPQERLSND
jgi:hypothetical protein